MTNKEIYSALQSLIDAFTNETKYFPAKVNFYIQKNKNALSQAIQTFSETRQLIMEQYGTLNDKTGEYDFSPENLRQANAELSDLLNISQNIEIAYLPLSWLEKLDFTPKQMEALFFMIEED